MFACAQVQAYKLVLGEAWASVHSVLDASCGTGGFGRAIAADKPRMVLNVHPSIAQVAAEEDYTADIMLRGQPALYHVRTAFIHPVGSSNTKL